jgi:cytochrome c oxidase subunit 2
MLKRFAFFLATLLVPAAAFADYPKSWELNLQPPAGPLSEQIYNFHHMLLWIISVIVVFVFLLLAWVIVRYNHKANPVPSTTTHNTMLEVVWTIIPVIILIVIAVPSFKVLFSQGRIPEADLTIKVTGYQWYWGYEYPDQGDISFNAYMIPEKDIDPSKGQKRLLETDNEVVVPVGKVIRVQVTGNDVIHAWTVPAFGIKKDAVPGRLNEAWFRVDQPGVYYGQCSEICGNGHAYMPIKVRAVTPEEFTAWVAQAKTKFGSNQTNFNIAGK